MADGWIKIRAGLCRHPSVFRIGRATIPPEPPPSVVFYLVELAEWFDKSGRYGTMVVGNREIDLYLGVFGVADALEAEGWLESNGDVRYLRYFCEVSATRKSLGREIRRKVLGGAVCACCGTPDRLCIDHVIPVSRGGSCEIENLQPLCFTCNARKGAKTMDEFMPGVPA